VPNNKHQGQQKMAKWLVFGATILSVIQIDGFAFRSLIRNAYIPNNPIISRWTRPGVISMKRMAIAASSTTTPAPYLNLPFDFQVMSYEEYLQQKKEEKKREEEEYSFHHDKFEVGEDPLVNDAFFEHAQAIATCFSVSVELFI
jgi:hypothetical protein